MVSENTTQKSRKIRIYPTREQKNLFKQWLGAYRFVYNSALAEIQKLPKTPSWLSFKTAFIASLPDWSGEIPYQIKSMAIKEAITNLRARKKMAKLNGIAFKMSFKARRDIVQSCYIPKSAVKEKGIYGRLSGKMKYKEALPEDPKDSRLQFAYGKWWICVPSETKTTRYENQGRVVAIDPGVRKFITFVSDSTVGQIGKGDIGRIYRLCHYLDDLYARMTKERGKKKKSMRKAATRMRLKIRNLVDELHHKSAKFLVSNYDVILLPKFETSQMVSKTKRRIRSKTARAMMTFSFYRFSQFLKHKAQEHGRQVVDVCEAYTSKTNNFTGEIDNKLGGRKFVRLGDKKIDRDINGALGILLRALVDSPRLRSCLQPQFAIVSEC